MTEPFVQGVTGTTIRPKTVRWIPTQPTPSKTVRNPSQYSSDLSTLKSDYDSLASSSKYRTENQNNNDEPGWSKILSSPVAKAIGKGLQYTSGSELAYKIPGIGKNLEAAADYVPGVRSALAIATNPLTYATGGTGAGLAAAAGAGLGAWAFSNRDRGLGLNMPLVPEKYEEAVGGAIGGLAGGIGATRFRAIQSAKAVENANANLARMQSGELLPGDVLHTADNNMFHAVRPTADSGAEPLTWHSYAVENPANLKWNAVEKAYTRQPLPNEVPPVQMGQAAQATVEPIQAPDLRLVAKGVSETAPAEAAAPSENIFGKLGNIADRISPIPGFKTIRRIDRAIGQNVGKLAPGPLEPVVSTIARPSAMLGAAAIMNPDETKDFIKKAFALDHTVGLAVARKLLPKTDINLGLPGLHDVNVEGVGAEILRPSNFIAFSPAGLGENLAAHGVAGAVKALTTRAVLEGSGNAGLMGLQTWAEGGDKNAILASMGMGFAAGAALPVGMDVAGHFLSPTVTRIMSRETADEAAKDALALTDVVDAMEKNTPPEHLDAPAGTFEPTALPQAAQATVEPVAPRATPSGATAASDVTAPVAAKLQQAIDDPNSNLNKALQQVGETRPNTGDANVDQALEQWLAGGVDRGSLDLEQAFSRGMEDPLAKAVYAHFEPVRQALREIYPEGTIPLFRAAPSNEAPSTLVSAGDQRIAQAFMQNQEPSWKMQRSLQKADVPINDIVAASDGTIGGMRLEAPDGSETPYNDFITMRQAFEEETPPTPVSSRTPREQARTMEQVRMNGAAQERVAARQAQLNAERGPITERPRYGARLSRDRSQWIVVDSEAGAPIKEMTTRVGTKPDRWPDGSPKPPQDLQTRIDQMNTEGGYPTRNVRAGISQATVEPLPQAAPNLNPLEFENSPERLAKVVDDTVANGGSSTSIRTGETVAGAGDMVSDPSFTRTVPVDEFQANGQSILKNFLTRNRDILDAPNKYLGTWVDNGQVHIDVSEHLPSEAARTQAAQTGQRATYDVATGKVVPVEAPRGQVSAEVVPPDTAGVGGYGQVTNRTDAMGRPLKDLQEPIIEPGSAADLEARAKERLFREEKAAAEATGAEVDFSKSEPAPENPYKDKSYKKTKTADGTLEGMPRTYTTTTGKVLTLNNVRAIKAWRNDLIKKIVKGQDARFWYEDSAQAMMKMVGIDVNPRDPASMKAMSEELLRRFGGDVNKADAFVQAVAITSPQTKVDENTREALVGFYDMLVNEPSMDIKTNAAHARLAKALQGEDWGSLKTNRFYLAHLRFINPKKFERIANAGATIDVWMARAMGLTQMTKTAYKNKLTGFLTNMKPTKLAGWDILHNVEVPAYAPTILQYKNMAREIAGLRDRMNLDPDIVAGRAPAWTDDQVQAAIWTAEKMSQEGSESHVAGFDYSDGLKQHQADLEMSFFDPRGRIMTMFPELADATPEEFDKILPIVRSVITNENGNNDIAQVFTLLGSEEAVVPTPTGAPAMTREVIAPLGAGSLQRPMVHQNAARVLNGAAAFFGKFFGLENSGWTRPIKGVEPFMHNAVQLPPGSLTTDEMIHLNGILDKNGVDATIVAGPQGIHILNNNPEINGIQFGKLQGGEELPVGFTPERYNEIKTKLDAKEQARRMKKEKGAKAEKTGPTADEVNAEKGMPRWVVKDANGNIIRDSLKKSFKANAEKFNNDVAKAINEAGLKVEQEPLRVDRGVVSQEQGYDGFINDAGADTDAIRGLESRMESRLEQAQGRIREVLGEGTRAEAAQGAPNPAESARLAEAAPAEAAPRGPPEAGARAQGTTEPVNPEQRLAAQYDNTKPDLAASSTYMRPDGTFVQDATANSTHSSLAAKEGFNGGRDDYSEFGRANQEATDAGYTRVRAWNGGGTTDVGRLGISSNSDEGIVRAAKAYLDAGADRLTPVQIDGPKGGRFAQGAVQEMDNTLAGKPLITLGEVAGGGRSEQARIRAELRNAPNPERGQAVPERAVDPAEQKALDDFLAANPVSGQVPAREPYLPTRDESYAKYLNDNPDEMHNGPRSTIRPDMESVQTAIDRGRRLGYRDQDIAEYLRHYIEHPTNVATEGIQFKVTSEHPNISAKDVIEVPDEVTFRAFLDHQGLTENDIQIIKRGENVPYSVGGLTPEEVNRFRQEQGLAPERGQTDRSFAQGIRDENYNAMDNKGQTAADYGVAESKVSLDALDNGTRVRGTDHNVASLNPAHAEIVTLLSKSPAVARFVQISADAVERIRQAFDRSPFAGDLVDVGYAGNLLDRTQKMGTDGNMYLVSLRGQFNITGEGGVGRALIQNDILTQLHHLKVIQQGMQELDPELKDYLARTIGEGYNEDDILASLMGDTMFHEMVHATILGHGEDFHHVLDTFKSTMSDDFDAVVNDYRQAIADWRASGELDQLKEMADAANGIDQQNPISRPELEPASVRNVASSNVERVGGYPSGGGVPESVRGRVGENVPSGEPTPSETGVATGTERGGNPPESAGNEPGRAGAAAGTSGATERRVNRIKPGGAKVGDTVRFNGEQYVVKETLPDGKIRAASLKNGGWSTLPSDKVRVVEARAQATVEPVKPEGVKTITRKKEVAPLKNAPDLKYIESFKVAEDKAIIKDGGEGIAFLQHPNEDKLPTLPDIQDVIDSNFIENRMRKLSNAVSKTKIGKAAAELIGGKAATAKTPWDRAVVAYHIIRDAGDSRRGLLINWLHQGETPFKEVIGGDGIRTGMVNIKNAAGEEMRVNLDDVFSNPSKYRLTEGQQAFIGRTHKILDDLVEEMRANGIDIKELGVEKRGEHYFPRYVKGVDGWEVAPRENSYVKSGLGQKANFQKARAHATMAGGQAAGNVYAHPLEALDVFIDQANRSIAGKKLLAALEPFSTTGKKLALEDVGSITLQKFDKKLGHKVDYQVFKPLYGAIADLRKADRAFKQAGRELEALRRGRRDLKTGAGNRKLSMRELTSMANETPEVKAARKSLADAKARKASNKAGIDVQSPEDVKLEKAFLKAKDDYEKLLKRQNAHGTTMGHATESPGIPKEQITAAHQKMVDARNKLAEDNIMRLGQQLNETVASQRAQIRAAHNVGRGANIEVSTQSVEDAIARVNAAREARDAARYHATKVNNQMKSIVAAKTNAQTAPASVFGLEGDIIPVNARGEVKLGRSNVMGLQGKLFPQEIADSLGKALDQSDIRGGLKTISDINNAARLARASTDFGYLFIQGLPVLASHPVAFAKAAHQAFEAMLNPDKYAQWLASKDAVVRDMLPFAGGHTGAEYFTFTKGNFIKRAADLQNVRGNPNKMLQKGLGFSTQRFGVSFEAFLDAAKISMWEGMMPYMKGATEAATRKNQEAYGRLLRNMTGTTSTSRLAVSPTQRHLEALLMFSPRFTRSVFALAAQAAEGGPARKQALLSMGLMMGGAVTLYAGVKHSMYLQGLTDEDFSPSDLDPTKGGRFMSIKVGDNWIGLGGSMRGAIQLAGNIASASTDPKRFLSTDSTSNDKNNPFLKFARGKLSPAASQVIDLATGQSLIGQDTTDRKAWLARLPDQFLPFAAQTMVDTEGGPSQKLGAFAANAVGLRTFPEAGSEDLNARVHELNKEVQGWSGLTSQQKADMLEQHPDVRKLLDKSEVQNWTQYREISQQAADAKAALAARWMKTQQEHGGEKVTADDLTSKEYRDELEKLNDKIAGARAVANGANVATGIGASQGEFGSPQSPRQALMADYYRVMDKSQFVRPDGTFDWDAKDAKESAFMATLSPADQKIVQEETAGTSLDPLEKRLKESNAALQPYWDIQDEVAQKMGYKDSLDVAQQSAGIQKRYNAAVTKAQVAWRKAHPTEDKQMVLWGRTSKLITQQDTVTAKDVNKLPSTKTKTVKNPLAGFKYK